MVLNSPEYGPASRAEHPQPRTCPGARQTVYETNSVGSGPPQMGRPERRASTPQAPPARSRGRIRRQ